MKAAKMLKDGTILIDEMPVPIIHEGDILVKTAVCGLCSGELMGWYTASKAPYVLGHEMAGTVVEVGREVTEFNGGDRVFAHHHATCQNCTFCEREDFVHCKQWRSSKIIPGGMAECFAVPKENLSDTFVIPDQMSFEQAAFIEPLACVVKSVERANIKPSDTVLVIGMGIMGLLHIPLLKQNGAKVIAADLLEARLEIARTVGADELINSRVTKLPENIANVVIVGPGSVKAIQAGISAVGPGGKVVMFAPTPPETDLTLNQNELYFKEITMTSSYSCGSKDTRKACELISKGLLDSILPFICHFKLKDLSLGYAQMASQKIVKALIHFD